VAETRLTSSSSTTAAEKKQEADTNHDAAENQELLVYIDTLEQDNDPVNRALSQMASTQVERGAQTVAWTGVVQALLVSSKLESVLERQRLEELQNQLALIAEDKKKQRKGLDGRETVIFEKLVSILGKPLAEQIALKIDKAITGQGAALQKDPAAVAKLSAELLSLLSSGDTLLKLGISPQEAEKALQRCFTTFERSLARSQTAPANSPDPRTSIVGDIVSSAKTQPQVTAAQLSTQAGLDLLRAQLAGQSSVEARIELLRSLQGALGSERFALVLDSYDRLTGRPLVYDCIHLSANSHVDQREILAALLDPKRSIINAAQLERLSQYAISDAAAILQTLKIEYSQIPQQITQVERLRIQSYSHLANALGIEAPSGVSDGAAHDQCLRAIVEKFPGLAGKTWEEVSKELYDLVGTTDSDSLKLGIRKLGTSSISASLTPSALQGLSASDRAEVHARVQADIKELAVRLLTHMRDISGHEQNLVELRQMLTAGPGQEESKVMARLESLYAGLLRNFSAETVTRQSEASRIYIEGLQARIESTTDPVALHGLCTERDSLQWRALQLRVATLLDQKPVAAERVSALLVEFQTAYPPGLRGRRGEYTQAADDILQALQTTTHYFQEVDRAFSTELQKLQEEQVRLDKLQQDQAGLVKAQEEVVAKYMTSWFNNYKQDKKRLDELKQALHDTEQRQRKVEEDLRSVEVAHKQALAQQIESLAQVGAAGSHTIVLASPKDVAAQFRFTKDSAKVQESLQTKLQAVDEARTKAQNSLARVDLVGRSACMHRDFGPAASATTTRLQQIVSHDRTMQPTPAALQALAAAVPAQSSIGRVLAAIAGSSRPTHEIIDLLFARLSADDIMRVKAFLLAYDRPDLFELVGRARPVDARAVWSTVEALEQSEKRQELSELLVVLPHLRVLVDCQELLASQPEGARADVLAEYQRIAGISLGQVVLARAPAGEPGRSNYLFALCGSPIVTTDDLRALFPGGIVPSELTERQRVFAQSLERDSTIDFALPVGFEELIQQQAHERAGLQVALSSMIQLDRDSDVQAIRRRLAELDSQFYRPQQTILAGYSADYIARSGIRQRLEGARDAATQMAKMSLLDPYGDLAQDARRLTTIIQREDVSSAQVLEFIRASSPSPERMMLLEVMYLQHASGRPFLGLSGDLRKDLGTKKGSVVTDQEQYDRLRTGNQSALAEYDLEMLSQGLRTKDSALTGRAILAMQAKEFGKETLRAAIEQSPEMKRLWQDYVASPVSRESVALYNAVMADDQRRIGIIKMVNGIGWSLDKSGDAIASLGQYKDEVAQLGGNAWVATEGMFHEIYGSSLGQTVASYVGKASGLSAQAWSDFVSSDAGKQTGACVAYGEHLLRENLDPAKLVDLINRVPVEHRKTVIRELSEFATRIDDSAVYQDGRSEAILIDYVRRKGGTTGDADAALLQAVLAGASGVTPAVSAEVLKRYQAERERLVSQQEDIDALAAMRGFTVEQARGFKDTVGVIDQTSRKDRDSRMFGKGNAQAVVDVHSKMLASQTSLVRGMEMGVDDIQSTKEVMRVRAVAILKDLTAAQDRGLTSEQNDRDFGSLRQRDAEREWAVARRDEVKRWQVNAEVAQKALANFDWWFEVGHSSLKVAVIIGLGMVPGVGPLTVLGVATAWNVADKAYKVTYRGMSLSEATRQFAVEFAIDAVCAGAWKLAVRVPTPWFKHISQFARDNVVVKNSKVLLGKLPGFRANGEIVNPEAFKSIRGFFGQTRLASKVEKLVEKTLTQANKKIADPLLFAKDVKYSFERIWLSLRPTDLARLAPSLSSAPATPVPNPQKAEIPELDGGGGATTGTRKTNTSTMDIPDVIVGASNKPSVDHIADLLKRATELGKDAIIDPTKQILDSIKKGDVAGQLLLVENWIRELGIKFSGQQPEGPLQQLQTLVESVRMGTQDLTALYPYIPPLMFLMGVNPAQLDTSTVAQGDGQQKSPDQWEDYSSNFALFNGMFDFLNPGWSGLWIAYKDNAPFFPPPSPPAQPPPPPPHYRRPGDAGGSGSGTVPGLTIHVAQDEQRRRPIEVGDAKVVSDPRYHDQAVARAREQTQELFERRQALHAIEQALQAHMASAVNAQSSHERLGNVDRNSEQRAQLQVTSIPTMKTAAAGNATQETGRVNSQVAQYVTRQEVAASAASEAVGGAQSVSRRNAAKSEQVEEVDVISVALRSREREVPKMTTAKPVDVEQKNKQQQKMAEVAKGLLESNTDAVDQVSIAIEAQSKLSASRVNMQRITTLREDREQPLSRSVSHAEQQAFNRSGLSLSTRSVAEQDSASEIDASALAHSDIVEGAAGQKPEYAERDVSEGVQQVTDDSSSSDAQSTRPIKKKRKNKLQLREEARLRGIIMHQLMTQTLERAKREKLLRMLAALGMSEQEYRAFLTRLHVADAKREEAAKIQEAHKIALAVEQVPQSAAPTMKQDAPKIVKPEGTSPKKTRAELFARLRNQHADKIH
jgi:hypothetical protein